MFSASPEWTDRDCSIPEYKKTVTSVHTHKHTRLHRDGGAGSGVGGRFITTTPEDVTAQITQWKPTGAEDGRNTESCQKRKRQKTHRDQKCVSVSIATHRQLRQPGAPGVIKQREKGAGRRWCHRHSLQKEKVREREKRERSMIFSKNGANIKLREQWWCSVEWH